MGLADKHVLVIGGGSGIGFAVAQGAVADGARVTLASTSLEKVSAAAQALGNAASAARLDVTDEAAVEAFFAGATFDHIVFTAGDWGGPRRGLLAELDLVAAESLFRVRFWGAAAVAKHAAKVLPPGGSLTFTDGMVAHKPAKGAAISSAMAGAVEHLTRALAVELAPIRVNCVCPGLIRTGVWDRIPEDRREAQMAEMTRNQLIARVGEAPEAAEAYLYLMRGGYTTGQVLRVDGGLAPGA